MQYYDAHCHLQDPRLSGVLESAFEDYERIGLSGVVVNGTNESDWEKVAALAEKHDLVHPLFGLHPWFVNQAGSEWRNTLKSYLKRFPTSGVGEIGLDRWVKGFNIERQREAFEWQLAIAQEFERPVSIHCLRAWGMLLETLRASALPRNGFLLHSYGGPVEMVDAFVELGGYFSISAYFAHDRKHSQRDVFKHVPIERLLIETDAPDMSGPSKYVTATLEHWSSDMNHPANIEGVYAFAAELLGMEVSELSSSVSKNWNQLFGSQ